MHGLLLSLCLFFPLFSSALASPSAHAMDPAARCDEQCLERARQGETDALYQRGRHHLEGFPDGKPRPRWAIRWFRKAADRGHVDAQYAYAWMLLTEPSPRWDHRNEATRWLRRAADSGHEPARLLLENIQYHRLSTPVHYPEWPTATP